MALRIILYFLSLKIKIYKLSLRELKLMKFDDSEKKLNKKYGKSAKYFLFLFIFLALMEVFDTYTTHSIILDKIGHSMMKSRVRTLPCVRVESSI